MVNIGAQNVRALNNFYQDVLILCREQGAQTFMGFYSSDTTPYAADANLVGTISRALNVCTGS
jgi:hypothetical protein